MLVQRALTEDKIARFSWAHYEALVRREHLNSAEVSERIRRETGKRIHPEIVEQILPCVVNNSFKEKTAVSVFTLESATADSNESAVLKYRVEGIDLSFTPPMPPTLLLHCSEPFCRSGTNEHLVQGEFSCVIGCNADGSERLFPKDMQYCPDDAEH